jgi:CheY-like chemotaxis protein
MTDILKIVLPPVLNLLVVLAIVLFFWAMRERLAQLFDTLGIKSAELPGGFRVERFETLTVEAYAKQELGPPSEDDKRKIYNIGAYLAPLAAGRRILWVDDNPGGNSLERAALLELRIDVQTRRDTGEALAELRDPEETYDVVISDWHRGSSRNDEASEGLRLLHSMRSERIKVPLIFYHGPVGPDQLAQRRQLAHAAGAVGATGSPGELFRWTMIELVKKNLDDGGAATAPSS